MLKHPLHPALVHFPLAAWVFAAACDAAGWWTGQAHWWRAAWALILTGVAMALPAMAAGMLELKKLEGKTQATGTVYRHIALVGTAWTCYLVSAVLRSPSDPAPGPAALLLALFGLAAVLAGGYYGGTLVYRHGVGVGENGR